MSILLRLLGIPVMREFLNDRGLILVNEGGEVGVDLLEGVVEQSVLLLDLLDVHLLVVLLPRHLRQTTLQSFQLDQLSVLPGDQRGPRFPDLGGGVGLSAHRLPGHVVLSTGGLPSLRLLGGHSVLLGYLGPVLDLGGRGAGTPAL